MSLSLFHALSHVLFHVLPHVSILPKPIIYAHALSMMPHPCPIYIQFIFNLHPIYIQFTSNKLMAHPYSAVPHPCLILAFGFAFLFLILAFGLAFLFLFLVLIVFSTFFSFDGDKSLGILLKNS